MSYVSDLRALVGSQNLILAGATVLVRNENGEFLFNLRSDTHTWGFPGGCLEPGESLEYTARRELYEETGLEVKKLRLLTVLSGPEFHFIYPNGDETDSVIALYLAETNGEMRINDNESEKLGFFSPDNLPPLELRAEKIMDWLKDYRNIIKCGLWNRR